MNRLLKIIQILIFTVFVLIVGVFVWQFFDPYAQLLFLPLGILSIYYLLIYSFCRLMLQQTAKIWFYVGIVFIIVPLIAFSVAYRPILELSLNILEMLSNR